MSSPEFRDNIEPVDMATDVSAMLDTPDDPDRRPALPHEAAPEATDYLNGVQTVDFGEGKQSLFDDHETKLNQLRAEVAAYQDEAEEPDSEVAEIQARIDKRINATREQTPSRRPRAVQAAKYSFLPPVSVNDKYL